MKPIKIFFKVILNLLIFSFIYTLIGGIFAWLYLLFITIYFISKRKSKSPQ